MLTFQKVVQPIAFILEQIAVKNFMHIGLTGGQLYKTGVRKDVDFVVYHIRDKQPEERDKDFKSFISCLGIEGFSNVREFGFVTKCTFNGYDIDIMFPEWLGDGSYPEEGTTSSGPPTSESEESIDFLFSLRKPTPGN